MTGIYNLYTPPFYVDIGDTRISIMEEDDSLLYKREDKENVFEKIFLGSGDILINPIEPVNIPKDISPFMLIEFEKPVLVEPVSKQKIFLTYPNEIGIFISQNNNRYKILDIIGLAAQKYTLYGTHTRGMVCKYWKSDVFTSSPKTDILYEGVIELDISNETNEWMEVKKVVFNAYGMKIYHGDNKLAMRANLKILGNTIAESSFTTYPTTSRFKRSVELYTAHKLMLTGTKCVMEHGL
jgi:hypothetical protein